MTESGAKPGRRKLRKYLLVLMFTGLLLAGAAWYLTSDSFQAYMRRRVIAELERVTGGRVELGSLHTSPLQLRIEVRNLTIHGLENAGEIPYVHGDSLTATIRVISLLETEFGFGSIVLENPVVHIIFYPDGTTNQPAPRVKATSQKTPVEQLFAFSINHLEVRRGMVLWGDQRIPLDLTAQDISADMSYSLLRRRYDGSLLIGKADTKFDGYRPFAWAAQTHFSLGRDSLAVEWLKATSGNSHFQASGRIENFRQPNLEVNYDVSLDLGELAAIARRAELRRGVFEAHGQGVWSAQDFSSTGKLALKNLDWREPPVGIHNVSLDSQFSMNSRQLTLSQIRAQALGGSVTGDAEIMSWLSLLGSNKQAGNRRSEEQRGSAKFQLKDLSAAEIAAALSTPARPFHRVKVAGTTSGTLTARWKGSPRNAEVQMILEVTPPVHPEATQLPLKVHMRGAYRAGPGELELSELTAATRSTQVRASGTLSRTAALKLSVTTTDLGEWQPILTAAGYAGPLPITIKGHASFNGTATGKLSDIAFAGALQSQDFEVLIPATSKTLERQVHWDFLAADVQLSPQILSARNGTLRHGNSAIGFDLSAHLEERQFTPASHFFLRVDMRNADLAELLAMSGYDYPASGIMDFQLQLRGTRTDPHGQGHLEIRGGTIFGETLESFSSDLALDGSKAELKNIQLTHSGARVAGGASYDHATHAFRFDLTGSNFDLARVSEVQGSRVLIEGSMDFTALGSGTLEEPSINSVIRLHDLTFDHERAGDFTFNTVTQGAELRLTGQSRFDKAELKIDGTVHLRDGWPADLALHFNRLDVDSLLRTYLRGRVTGHSAVAGDLQLRGPLLRPRELQIAGTVGEVFADVENVKVHNDGPIRFSVSRELLRIEQLHLVGEGTDVTASGTAQLTGESQLDLRAQGSVNLKLIESLNPDFTSSGMISADVTVSGTAAKPSIQGRLRIENGAIAYIDLPSALSDINGSLVFNQDRLQVETLTARTGGGLVQLGGYATSYNRQLNFNLTVKGEDVRLRYPPGVSSTATAELHFAGTPAASTLSGEITVTKLAMTPGFDFGAYLERSAQTSALPPTNPLLNRIRLDVHVVTTPELQMQTAIIRLSGDADLRLRGTASKPVILGRANVIEGEVYFNGTKYRLERGDISFIDPVTTRPVLDLQASTRVRDYDITLNVNGQIDHPNVTYRSEPPLPTSDIIGLLAFGQTTEESAQLQQSGQSAFNQGTSSAILSAALNATVTNRVQRLFGVSRIKIDPQGLTTETSPTQTGPAVTIEQQVKNNLTLTYTTNVAQTSQQIIQVEYNLTRNVSIVGLRDQNGVVSIDVRIRQRKK